MVKKFYKLSKIIAHTLYGLILLLVLLNWVFPFKVTKDFSKSVYASNGELMSAYLNKTDKWRLYTPLNSVSPLFLKTIVTKEDRWFNFHFGFNPVSIVKAVFKNTVSGRRKGGASTITMQVVRLIKPQKRNYLNKAIEIFRAVQLEYQFSKNEILELYVNLLPYGGNIEGLATASYCYFGKSPQLLSLSESVILSIIPNKPNSLNIKKNQGAINQAKNKWILNLSSSLDVSKTVIDDALMENFTIQYFALPKIAPQFCNRLVGEYSKLTSINTTINYQYQLQVQDLLYQYLEKLKEKNINNGSVYVIDNLTGNVLVYCGSNDFGDKDNAGQVDGVKAIRSPGSALKPFLYGMSFEMGLYTPSSVVLDIPIYFGSYTPKNYDETFKGTVNIKEALVNSLNVPAVNLLNEMGVKSFISFLKSSGFKSIKNQNLGLSLALGGCGVSLEELTTAYSVLANDGKLYGKRMIKTKHKLSFTQVLSPAANYLVTSILQTVQRPDLPMQLYQNTFRVPKVAWKTGTSFGRKDAWAIGYNKKFTIGVWVGNFDGEGVASLSGGEIATPLLFDIFNTIDYNSNKQWFNMPKGLNYRYVCSYSGNVPSANCHQLINDLYIEKQTIQKVCEHSVLLKVSMDSSVYYCNSCIGNNAYFEKSYPNFQPQLINYFEQEKVVYKKWPPHHSQCQRVENSGELQVLSPINESEYLLEQNSESKLMLNASVDYQASTIFWYINDKLVIQSQPNQAVFVKMPIGKLKITCSDNLGRKKNVFITVKYF